MTWLRMLLGAAALGISAAGASYFFGTFPIRQLEQQVGRLEDEKAELIDYARRLSASRRVAQVEALHQRTDGDGRVVTMLLWQEIGSNGILGKPVAIEAVGRQIYFEALVIKFEPQFVGAGDNERGASLALFRRIFGDQQTPQSADELDRAARPPLDDPRVANPLHDRLWDLFWELVDDPKLATQYGVRVAQCEAPAVPVKPGDLWEIRLDAVGSLNLKKLGSRIIPIDTASAQTSP